MTLRPFARLTTALLLSLAPLALAQAPANDACSNAIAIPGTVPATGYSTVVVTTGAVDDATDPAPICLAKGFPIPLPTGAVSKSVWFTFTPSVTDNYQIDTLGSSPASEYDTILVVYTGSCGNLTPLANACNDDLSGSLQSSVSLALNAGTTYTIFAAGIGARDSFNPSVIEPSRGGSLKLNVKHVQITYPYKYVIPSVANFQGQTLFVSDLAVTNAEAADGSYIVQFLGNGAFNDQNPPASQPSLPATPIAAQGSREYVDVLGTSFGLPGSFGALYVQSTRKLVLGARTYTTAPGGGTYGQFAPGYDLSTESLSFGETGRLIALRDDASYRTNVVLYNLSPFNCAVQLETRDNLGQIYPSGARLPVLPPSTMVQINGLKSYFGFDSDIRNAHLAVRNSSPNCTIGAVAYVIDRTTNDPFAVPLRK